MTWRPENGAQFIVVPRYGGADEAKWFEADLGWIFHFSNAFPRNGEIGVDGCRSDTVENDVSADDGGGPVAQLNRYVIPLEGANAVVIGRSEIVGKPVSLLLQQRNATVTMCHSRTQDLAGICRQADILVAATGRPRHPSRPRGTPACSPGRLP